MNELHRLLATGIFGCGLAHKLDGLPCGEAFGGAVVRRAEIVDVGLESKEGLPVCIGESFGSPSEQKLCYYAGRVGKDLGVELGENLAFVFV